MFLFSWKMVLPFYHVLPFKDIREMNREIAIVHREIGRMIEFKAKIQEQKGTGRTQFTAF